MDKNLVIVESPTKAKAIQKYLGEKYCVVSTGGHIRRLNKAQSAIDVDADFACKYQMVPGKSSVIKNIRQAIGEAQTIYIATDYDREGEGIGWHIVDTFKKDLCNKTLYRATFVEVNPEAIQKAIEFPKELDMDLIDAYKARNILDFLIGFHVSPILWRAIAHKLGAGRVQGPALTILTDREEEIEKHVTSNYWTIHGTTPTIPDVQLSSIYIGGKLIGNIFNDLEVKQYMSHLPATVYVSDISAYSKTFKSPRPFITSTLQQEASSILKMRSKRLMNIAQQLYEGNGETVGLITYPRTDSFSISESFQEQAKEFFAKHYPSYYRPYVGRKGPSYAQESHECIRVVDLEYRPTNLTAEQSAVYDLIRRRTLSALAIEKVVEYKKYTLSPCIKDDDGTEIHYISSTIICDGYSHFQLKGKESRQSVDLAVNDKICVQYQVTQKETKPRDRLSEGSLIKALTDFGIGRPSTYDGIISTLYDRQYIEVSKGSIRPTVLGRLVVLFLRTYFAQYIDYSFTSYMEEQLDLIASAKQNYLQVLRKFWGDLAVHIKNVEGRKFGIEFRSMQLNTPCPECGSMLLKRLGRYKDFTGCSAYPKCKFILRDKVIAHGPCPECSADLVERSYKRSKFIGCSNYPKCKFIKKLPKE